MKEITDCPIPNLRSDIKTAIFACTNIINPLCSMPRNFNCIFNNKNEKIRERKLIKIVFDERNKYFLTTSNSKLKFPLQEMRYS